MITALLGIVVNIIMGFSLHQGSHKHFHTHIGGGSCSAHDHGDSKLMDEPDIYELKDLKNMKREKPKRSRSLDIRCEKNRDNNEYHHHHIRADATDCCDLEDCSIVNINNGNGIDNDNGVNGNKKPKCKDHHNHSNENEEHLHDHDDDDEEAHFALRTDQVKKENNEKTTHETSGHAHKHHDHKHHDHHDHKHHDHKHHDHKHHDHHDHDHHEHDKKDEEKSGLDGMNVNIRAAYIHILGKVYIRFR